MIYQRAVAQTCSATQAITTGPKRFEYYAAAANLCAGPVSGVDWAHRPPCGADSKRLVGLGAAVDSACLLRLQHVFVGHSDLVPHLWPFSYYNTRYGLAALPCWPSARRRSSAWLRSAFVRAPQPSSSRSRSFPGLPSRDPNLDHMEGKSK